MGFSSAFYKTDVKMSTGSMIPVSENERKSNMNSFWNTISESETGCRVRGMDGFLNLATSHTGVECE